MVEEECIPYEQENATPALEFDTNFTMVSAQGTLLMVAENVIYEYVLKAVCACGLVGNVLNLVVLTSQSLTRSMERLEKCAHAGLLSLAVSDMLFCLLVLMVKKVGLVTPPLHPTLVMWDKTPLGLFTLSH